MRCKGLKHFAAAAVVSAAFAAAPSPADAGGSLSLNLPTMPTGYPIVASGGLADILATNVISEGLTRWKADTLEVEGALATSWDTDAQARVWTFNLRQGVRWHDGRPFSAEDVKFTFDLIRNRNVRAAAAGQVPTLEGVEVVSPTQVRMTFSQPNASLPLMLAYRMPIVPKHLLEGQDPNQPTAFIEKPVGTGAFRFASAASGQHWTAEKNPDWWGGAVQLDSVVFRIMPDANTVIAQLRTGDVDVALIRPQQATALRGTRVAVQSVEQPSVYYISLLNQKPPFDDVRVRRAMNHAIDRAGLMRAVVGEYATLANGMIAPSIESYNGAVTNYGFDQTRARAILAEAGWAMEGGRWVRGGTPLTVELTTSTGVIGGPQIAQIVQQQLSQIGVPATINMVDFRDLWLGVFDGRFQTSVEYLNLQPSPDVGNALSCGASQNRFQYCDRELDQLFLQASATTDAAERARRYAQIQERVAANPPGIFLFYPQEVRAVADRVKGFPANPIRMATTRLFQVRID
jgi:peptide/nickel transport system substrate-binding protein